MDLRFIYLAAIFISMVEMFLYYRTSEKLLNKNFFLLYITTFFSNFGYAMSVYAVSVEGAMSGNLISYIGSIFTIFFMLLVIVEMCNTQIPKLLQTILLFSAIAICIIISTTNFTNLFFINASISKLHGMTVIEAKNGPAMIYYILYLAFINIYAIAVVIRAIIKKERVSKKTSWILLFMLFLGTLTYIVPFSLGIKINFMPYTYILLETFFLFISIRAKTYNIAENLMEAYKSRGGYGYIAFDNNRRFLGCDEFALTLFPDLKHIPIDSKIPSKFTDIISKLHYKDDKWNWDYNCNIDFKIEHNETSVICTIHHISTNNKSKGYLFELRDDTEQQNYINGINSFNRELSKLIEEKVVQITDMQDSIIRGMAIMVESRDNSTGGHILRTSDCIKIFTDELLRNNKYPSCTKEFCALLVKAATMHDLGKIGVDDSILRKPGKFDVDEYEKMKDHAEKGSIIVSEVLSESTDKDFVQIAVNVAHYHHEKWDGTGYPSRLKGKDIPLEARIMALADVFDALVTTRCYKEAMSFDDAFKIIKNDLGKHFDPEIGKLFLLCRPLIEDYYTRTARADILIKV